MASIAQELEHERRESKTYYTGAYSQTHPDLWVIHGEYYDLTPFISQHPGGVENLKLGQGRDCTELFESVHSLSHLNVHGMLAKYKVKIPEGYQRPPNPPLLFEKGGFYDILKNRVSNYFDTQTGGNHKADWFYWFKVTSFFVSWLSLLIYTLNTGSLLAPALAAVINSMMGFCVMHDASHYGVSYRPWVNQLLHTVWNDWNLWAHFNWQRHHVYGHHSYTGIFNQDPDLKNTSNFVRKHPNTTYMKKYETQHVHVWFLLMVAPNQHLGQAYMYLKALVSGKVFEVPLMSLSLLDKLAYGIIFSASLYTHFIFPFNYLPLGRGFLILLVYWTITGICYMVNVVPNHDTMDTHKSALQEGEKRDWGVQQILATGNHTTDGGLWSRFVASAFGGMNYQIEHHLFPSVSHIHYPEISKIVRKTCEEFHVNYVTHSWATALWRFGVLVWVLSYPEVGMPEGKTKRDE